MLVLEGMLSCIKEEKDATPLTGPAATTAAAEDAKAKAKLILTVDPSLRTHQRSLKCPRFVAEIASNVR